MLISSLETMNIILVSIILTLWCSGFQEKEEKLDGDAALNKLFRDIYQNADEDMRRAMSKSFVRYSLDTCFKLHGS